MKHDNLNSQEAAQLGISDVMASASQLVKDLAEWSRKYPRERVYPMSKISMDDELVKLEERAKELSQHLPLTK